jgi:hypothetical protein
LHIIVDPCWINLRNLMFLLGDREDCCFLRCDVVTLDSYVSEAFTAFIFRVVHRGLLCELVFPHISRPWFYLFIF